MKTEATLTNRVEALMERIRAVPETLPGRHLDDSTLAAYAMDGLPDDEAAEADEHLRFCEGCSQRLEDLGEEAEAWKKGDGPAFLAALRERMRTHGNHPQIELAPAVRDLGNRLAHHLQVLLQGLRTPAFVLGAPPPVRETASEDGFAIRVEEDEFGNRLVSINSTSPDLQGAQAQIEVFNNPFSGEEGADDQKAAWKQIVTLGPIPARKAGEGAQVMGRAAIPKSVWLMKGELRVIRVNAADSESGARDNVPGETG